MVWYFPGNTYVIRYRIYVDQVRYIYYSDWFSGDGIFSSCKSIYNANITDSTTSNDNITFDLVTEDQ